MKMDDGFGDYHDDANMDSCIDFLRKWNDSACRGTRMRGPNVVPSSPSLVDWRECGDEQ